MNTEMGPQKSTDCHTMRWSSQTAGIQFANAYSNLYDQLEMSLLTDNYSSNHWPALKNLFPWAC